MKNLNQKGFVPIVIILIIIVVCGIALSLYFPKTKLNLPAYTPTSTLQASPNATPTLVKPTSTPTITSKPTPQPIVNYAPKVLLVIYNPVLENQGGKKLVEFENWQSPDALTNSLINDIKNVSGGVVNYKIVERVELDDYPIKNDGFKYTDESYITCATNHGSSCHSPDMANYQQMLSQVGACEKINSGQIDEVWFFGGPWFGYYESNLAGPGAFWYNSPPTTGTSCQKLLPIMGFNYERGEAEMFHDFGHRLESVMAKVGEGNNNFFKTGNNGGCGKTHFPVNTSQEYNYSDSTTVSSSCGGRIENINCNSWGCNQLGFFKWFFTNMPKTWWGNIIKND